MMFAAAGMATAVSLLMLFAANVSPTPTDAPEVTAGPTAEIDGTTAPTDIPAATGEPEATSTVAPTTNGGT